MRRKHRAMLAVVAVCCVLLVGAAAVACNGRVATHFGYALPGDGGLPGRISYAGRDYSYFGACWSDADLQQHGVWPLHQVAQVPTLLGAAHPVLSASVPHGMTTMELAIPKGSCYAVYGIEGGP